MNRCEAAKVAAPTITPGTFIAVRNDSPAQYPDYPYYLMLVADVVEVNKEDFVDADGVSFAEGDVVVKGTWLQFAEGTASSELTFELMAPARKRKRDAYSCTQVENVLSLNVSVLKAGPGKFRLTPNTHNKLLDTVRMIQ